MSDNEQRRASLQELITYLCTERSVSTPDEMEVLSEEGLFTLFRSLVNTRQPVHGPQVFYDAQDALLQELIAEDGIVSFKDIPVVGPDKRLKLWKGDITRLKIDAIVNAANNELLGCWVPGHDCIDNTIHTFAGVQLREECFGLIQRQGGNEPSGSAKITDAYNLPSQAIIHTVGPAVEGTPTVNDQLTLVSSYERSLDLVQLNKLHSVAFPSISTGVFGYPKQEAAQLAITTVVKWLDAHAEANITVVFDVFSEEDYALYEELLLNR